MATPHNRVLHRMGTKKLTSAPKKKGVKFSDLKAKWAMENQQEEYVPGKRFML